MGKVLNVATNVATGGLMGFDKGFTTGVVSGAADKALLGGKIGSTAEKAQSGIFDTIMGKKTPGTPDSVIDLASPTGRALQEQLLGQYGETLGQDTSGMAAQQVASQEAQARQLAKDQEMRAGQLVAQRGMGGTASGIGQILGQQRGLGEQVSAIRAQQPALAQQMKQQNLNFATSGINQILNEQGQSRALKMGQAATGRQGGLLPLIGGAAGAYLGGPAGAQVGMGLGQAATQIG